MLLNSVYVYHNDGAKTYIVREPERLNHDALLRETVHEGYNMLGSTNTFLQDIRHSRMRYLRSAAEISEIVQKE